ncbi:MAG: ribosome maturation factor RimP [Desulfobacterium sp.]|nr:ribosome maturation factor RimP [Desulfobacterium sp.]
MKIQQKNQDPIIVGIEEVAEPLCLAEGFELVHVERLSDQGGMLVRVYLDKPSGITIDDCVHMARQLGDLIDVHLEDIESYRLEVSSPGSKRPLKKAADFERFKGRKVKIETFEPIEDRQKFTGILNGIQDGCVEVVVNKKTIAFQFEQISKSRLA